MTYLLRTLRPEISKWDDIKKNDTNGNEKWGKTYNPWLTGHLIKLKKLKFVSRKNKENTIEEIKLSRLLGRFLLDGHICGKFWERNMLLKREICIHFLINPIQNSRWSFRYTWVSIIIILNITRGNLMPFLGNNLGLTDFSSCDFERIHYCRPFESA